MLRVRASPNLLPKLKLTTLRPCSTLVNDVAALVAEPSIHRCLVHLSLSALAETQYGIGRSTVAAGCRASELQALTRELPTSRADPLPMRNRHAPKWRTIVAVAAGPASSWPPPSSQLRQVSRHEEYRRRRFQHVVRGVRTYFICIVKELLTTRRVYCDPALLVLAANPFNHILIFPGLWCSCQVLECQTPGACSEWSRVRSSNGRGSGSVLLW